MNIPHPYESQYKICAYPNENGTYTLCGPTYHSRGKIKSLGGTWDLERRTWTVSEQAILELQLLIVLRVRVAAHCHEVERVICATHKEVACGYMRQGCGHCDTIAICGDDVEILEVLENADVIRLANTYTDKFLQET